MKTQIIKNTRIGISNIASVFAQKTTTWALDMAREDQKERAKVYTDLVRDQKRIHEKLADLGVTEAQADAMLLALATKYRITIDY